MGHDHDPAEKANKWLLFRTEVTFDFIRYTGRTARQRNRSCRILFRCYGRCWRAQICTAVGALEVVVGQIIPWRQRWFRGGWLYLSARRWRLETYRSIFLAAQLRGLLRSPNNRGRRCRWWRRCRWRWLNFTQIRGWRWWCLVFRRPNAWI